MTTLLIPGLDGSPGAHWQRWWQFGQADAILLPQDDFARPDPLVWETRLATVLSLHPGALVVAHSLGAILAVRTLLRWPGLSAGGLLLVAPADVEHPVDGRVKTFGALPRGLLPCPTIVAASRNDPWMTFERATGAAASWGALVVDLGHAGHVNVASGHGPWPDGLALAALLRLGAVFTAENVR